MHPRLIASIVDKGFRGRIYWARISVSHEDRWLELGVEVWAVIIDPDLDTAPGEVIGDLAYVLARVLGASTS